MLLITALSIDSDPVDAKLIAPLLLSVVLSIVSVSPLAPIPPLLLITCPVRLKWPRLNISPVLLISSDTAIAIALWLLSWCWLSSSFTVSIIAVPAITPLFNKVLSRVILSSPPESSAAFSLALVKWLPPSSSVPSPCNWIIAWLLMVVAFRVSTSPWLVISPAFVSASAVTFKSATLASVPLLVKVSTSTDTSLSDNNPPKFSIVCPSIDKLSDDDICPSLTKELTCSITKAPALIIALCSPLFTSSVTSSVNWLDIPCVAITPCSFSKRSALSAKISPNASIRPDALLIVSAVKNRRSPWISPCSLSIAPVVFTVRSPSAIKLPCRLFKALLTMMSFSE